MSAPIRTLVVDDELAARDLLRLLLRADPEIELVGDCGDGAEALELIRRDRPALVLLDIQMPAMDGLAVLAALAEEELPVVVFVTAYDQHALRAFELHAVDYLLKPFPDGRFYQALARAKQRVRLGELGRLAAPLLGLLADWSAGVAAPRWLERLVIPDGGRSRIVPVAQVDWIEARGDYLRIHAGPEVHLLRQTMKEVASRLDPREFLRIHRSTIVRLGRIRELQPYFRGALVAVLADGTRLRVARNCRGALEGSLGREG